MKTRKPDLIMRKIFAGKANSECFTSYTTDEKGNKIGYLKMGEKGARFVVTESAKGNIVASTNLLDMLVIFSRNFSGNKTEKQLLFPNGKGLQYYYDKNYNITEVKAV